MPPSTAVAGSTVAPTDAPKKKTGLVVGIAAAIVLLGGAGAFFAMKGSGEQPKQAPVAAAPTPSEPAQVAPEPPKPAPAAPSEPEPAKPVEAPKPAPATINILISVDKAQVSVDGNPVEVTGKTAKATVESEGTHLITVTAAGREPFEQTVETKAGGSVQVIAKLERAKSTSKKPTGTGTKTPAATPTKTPPADGAGSAKKPIVDKNAPIDPF
jgi:hypothetical protein